MVPSGLPGPDKQLGRVLWPIGTIRALFLPGFKAQLARCRGSTAEGGIHLRIWNHAHHLGNVYFIGPGNF
jgi:hypothetical protein